MGGVVSSIGGLLGMKNLFKTPTPPEAVKPATPASPAVQNAVAEAARRRARASGYQSTILGGYMAPATPGTLKNTVGS